MHHSSRESPRSVVSDTAYKDVDEREQQRTKDTHRMSQERERVAFITGLAGQDGSYLAEFLLSKDYHVYGIIRRMSLINTARIDAILHTRNPRFHHSYGDVTDGGALYRTLDGIARAHPNACLEVYHLAAQSHVRVSFDIPEYTAEVDAMGTLKVLEACRTLRDAHGWSRDQLRVYVACTSELYGEVLEKPQTETTPFNPRSPYAVAKQFAFYMAKNYRESYDMYICNGILFNHESPRRGFNFVTRKVTLGLGKILRGEETELVMGNIDSVRDWGHARDFVQAMWGMMQLPGTGDDYVVATNETHTVREFIEKAFVLRGMPLNWQGARGTVEEVGVDASGVVRVRVHPRYFRPTEVAFLWGDARKAREAFGWTPATSFDELVAEMVEADASVHVGPTAMA